MVADPYYKSRLLRGFYDGTEGWKWTAPSFAVSLDAPEPRQRSILVLDFSVPEELMQQVSTPVTVTATVNGTALSRSSYAKAGRYNFVHDIPAAMLDHTPAEIAFSVKPAGAFPDGRPRGIIVVRVTLAPYDETLISREALVKAAHAGYDKLIAERNQLLPADKQKEMMKLFHDIPVWHHMWFHNVQIDKNPLDLWTMQQIMFEIQPEFVIETGTFRGGSALYWAHTLNGLGLEKSRVITVDIQDLTKVAATHPL
jgi:hypothetical protein